MDETARVLHPRPRNIFPSAAAMPGPEPAGQVCRMYPDDLCQLHERVWRAVFVPENLLGHGKPARRGMCGPALLHSANYAEELQH